jgi:hypothetical protein
LQKFLIWGRGEGGGGESCQAKKEGKGKVIKTLEEFLDVTLHRELQEKTVGFLLSLFSWASTIPQGWAMWAFDLIRPKDVAAGFAVLVDDDLSFNGPKEAQEAFDRVREKIWGEEEVKEVKDPLETTLWYMACQEEDEEDEQSICQLHVRTTVDGIISHQDVRKGFGGFRGL